jgi:hypothetical protein
MGLLPALAATPLLAAGCLGCLLLADLRRPALTCVVQASTSRQLRLIVGNSSHDARYTWQVDQGLGRLKAVIYVGNGLATLVDRVVWHC